MTATGAGVTPEPAEAEPARSEPAEAEPAETEPAETDWAWAEADPRWIPPDIDATRPSAARMYDYALGGKDNFAIDRAAVAQISEVFPDHRELALANRAFMVSAVDAMARSGIDQFLDLGTGIPKTPAVHDVAQQVHPGAQVLYVDNDPTVMAQNRALRGSHQGVLTACLDLRQPDVLLSDPVIQKGVDLERPIGLVLTSVLHFVRSDLAPRMIARYRQALAPGSQIAISVMSRDGTPAELMRRMEQVYGQSATPVTFRSTAQIEQLLEGWELEDPGLTDVTAWRRDSAPCTLRMLAGLARVG